MPPPRKALEDGKVNIHAGFVPLSAPLSFVSPNTVCYVVASSICLWNISEGTREYVHTNSFSISKVCGNSAKGLFAFCEGGTSPQAFIYSMQPRKLLFTLSGLTELELADLAFSRCGTRLYALSRATSKRLQVFSTRTGKLLPGCELTLPLRFDKVVVYPNHKDHLALIRNSSVRLVTIQKSYDTYIMRLLPASVAADADLSVSAYAWTPSGHFLFATRQGTLIALDGATGSVLHACQVDQPIASIAVTPEQVLTMHIGNVMKFWSFNPQDLTAQEGAMMLQQSPMAAMEGGWEPQQGPYALRRTIELDGVGHELAPEQRLMGQVASLQVAPDAQLAVLTTAEGEVWISPLSVPQGGDGSAEDAEGEAAEEPLLRLLTWFHTHPVSDLIFLGPTSRLCASADESGRLRIWQLTQGEDDPKGLRTLCFSSALTSLAADDEGRLIFVGTDTGCVHVVASHRWHKSHIVDTLHLSEAGVAKLCCVGHDENTMYIAAALFNDKIAFLSTALDDPRLVMYGFVDILGTVDDICWHRDISFEEEPKLLVAGTGHDNPWSCIWMIRAPPLDHEATVADLTREVCPMQSMKLSSPQRPEEKPTALASVSQDTIIVGFANGAMRFYPVPSTTGLPLAKHPVTQALDSLSPHEQLITRLRVSGDGGSLLSASMDGTIRKSTLDDGSTGKIVMQKMCHNPYNGGVAQVCTNVDDEIILSTGGSDGLLVWSNPAANIETPEPGASVEEVGTEDSQELEPRIVNIDDKDLNEFPIWAPISAEERERRAAEENDDPEVNALALAQRRALTLEVENLRKKLRVLIDQNNTCPELERLERHEFCVDFEERDLIAAKTKERCDALRAEIERENLARQLIRDRLIKEFWDPMKTKGCQITSLSTNLAVSNYPERIISEEEQSTLRKLRIMRQVEHLEVQMLKSAECPAALKGDVVLKADSFASGKEYYVVNWWHTGSVAQKGEQAHSTQKFMYEPFELLSNSRRRLQIHMLQSLAAEYRTAFNELFRTCQGDKKGIMDQIKEKVTRTRSILAELQVKEKVPEPELADVEDAQAVLQVKDREITVEKWISPEERRAIEEAKAKEEERLRLLRENDAGQRALNQMMGGTLKTKKDLSALEITLDKEPWMDQIPEDELSEVQLAALREFREKEKALADDQDKYRKQLDAELKKLRAEVNDLTQQFEAVLKELHHQRFAHDAKFFCQELYCVRLHLALLQSVEDGHVLKQSTQDVDEAKNTLAETEAKLEEFNTLVASRKTKQEERLKHEREVASAQHFKQQFANSGLEAEAISALLQLFRKKKAGDAPISPERLQGKRQSVVPSFGVIAKLTEGSGGMVRTSTMVHAASNVPGEDPYPDLGTNADTSADRSQDEEASLECPEGVDDASFQRMLELRRDRLHAEAEVARGNAELQDMSGLLAHLQRERDDASQAHQRLQAELQEHADLMKREEYDIEILFKLKQGQVEVPQAAVVTDYSDAVVIDNEVVESRNRRILELGKEKVGTLETIKEFRKKLNLIQWEYKMLQMQTADLEERTKDVHMLRVTKGLQSLLKGGEEGKNKADADLLERKIEHLNSTTTQKEGALKKQYSMLSHATKLRKMENSMLEKKLRELQQNVIQREHIRRLRAPQGGPPQAGAKAGEKPRIIGGGGRVEENEAMVRAAQTGFREIKTRQQLMDAAKKHTEEIDVLRKELDRLRQKTFPSFVQLHEDRGYPDHR